MMRLGEILSSLYNISSGDIENAFNLQKQVGGYIGQILIQQGVITDNQLVGALSQQLSIPIFNKEDFSWNHDRLVPLLNSDLSIDFLINNNFVPIDFEPENKLITCITTDPLNSSVEEYLSKNTDYTLFLFLSTEQTLKELSRFYSLSKASDIVSLQIDDSPEKLKEMAFEAPIIKFLNNLLSRAVELRVTDIHIEPISEVYRIRFRIDGILHDMETVEESFYLATVSRIKLLSGLDIAEKRLPQDGKFTIKVASLLLDIRVSTIPMVKSESVVLRLLHRERLSFDIMQLGLEEDHADISLGLISRSYGILLVTGPTGSGKTTTLYSMLTRLNNTERKIITVEDPVEYQLEGINQIQVKTDIGLTFASALRSILRHDPDIIMVGEIRDRETAEIAIHSALTGHLVLSTLHTNDSPSSLFRLIEMGIEDYLLNASIIGVIAQRIIRKICNNCAVPKEMTDEVLKEFELIELHRRYINLFENGEYKFMIGKGCSKCAGTGYRGRMAIYECFEFDDLLKETFIKHRSLGQLRKLLFEQYNFRSLRQDGLIKVLKGLTTIEEVLRVT
ncbi:MAG TPA: Flp pilus assembly complex ATPase component TadA [Nitrospirae bacterium]|nr:Flp pilus assembly complex ATPase component TadA [Nitrospirota bacterium]